MSKIEKQYLSNTYFSELENWSVPYLLGSSFSYNKKYTLVKIGSFLTRNKTHITIEDNKEYKRVTIKINNGGVFLRDIEKGINIGTKKQFTISIGQFLVSKIDARNGAFGLATQEVNNAIITADFFAYNIDISRIKPLFIVLCTTTQQFKKFAQSASNGTTNRQRINEQEFLNVKIPLPSLEEQNELLENYNTKITLAQEQEQEAKEIEESIEEYLFRELGIEKIETKVKSSKLQFITANKVIEWGVNKILNQLDFSSLKYKTTSLLENINLFNELFRGKSPHYKKDSNKFILNQKCNRWNKIQYEYCKSVDNKWIDKIEDKFFTKENDILINSTGEGTIGRASNIYKQDIGYLYDSHLLLLRVNLKLINSEYFVYLFNSSYGQKQVEQIKSAQATKQTELGVNNLKKILFPLPPIDIQNQIANEITKRKARIEQLKKEAKKNRENAIKEFEEEIFKL